VGRFVIAAILCAASVAYADQTAPWAVGVTPEAEKTAQEELQKGNARFLEKDYAGALERYRAAIAAWDHPAIRFNVVRCLIQLDKPVEAQDNLKKALAYGAAPLEANVYTEALAYEKLLATQVGEVAVYCKQDGVQLGLDGKQLATCPVTATYRMTTGPHQIVAGKPGFLTKTYDLVVVGNKQLLFSITLASLGVSGRVVHRWPTWIPWSMLAGGLTVAGIGGMIQLKASNDMDRFDAQGAKCAMIGCDPKEIDRGLEDSARLENHIAIGVITTGAALAITGGVMLMMNRGRTVYEPSVQRVVTVEPKPGGGVVGITGGF
jgi:hypothetical protein